MPWEAPSIQNPIQKVLSTLSAHKVRALLIGGQACVFYGAAEFSRNTDLTLLASDDNLALLRSALRDLQARRIAVPPPLDGSFFFADMQFTSDVTTPMR